MKIIRTAPARTIVEAGFAPRATDFDHPPLDPVAWMLAWLEEAMRLPIPNPNAVYLATTSPEGVPSCRTMLLRVLDQDGALFFTNRQSAKGRDLEAGSKACILMHWDVLDRQIRLTGTARHATDAESDEYFGERPQESRLNAWASDQSRPVASRATLLARQDAARARFGTDPVTRPPHWGGYRVALERIEFWQGDPYRFHDRVQYDRRGSEWSVQRLMP